ncbi:MAG: hypothetical protein IPP06_16375 [Saprospiraceae bacterium]|nr:hypothetical protein [Candidatus Vicinibacter affinis]
MFFTRVKYYLFFFSILVYSCTTENSITFKCCPNSKAEIVFLCSDKTEAFADGTSEIILTACIPKESDETILQVTFEVPPNAGNFSSEGGTNVLTKSLDGNKTATARMQVGNIHGSYTLKVKVTFDQKTFEQPINIVLMPNDNKVLNVVFDQDLRNLTGDNFSVFKSDISVKNYNYAGKSVKVNISGPISFLTSDLKEMSVTLDVLGKANIKFKTTDSDGLVNIKYNLEIYTVDTTFYIQKSYPDEMKLVANKQLVEIKDTVALDVFFNKKTPGSVSKEISIQLSAFQLQNGNKVKYGNFIPPYLFTTGNAINTANAKSIYLTPVDSFGIQNFRYLFLQVSLIRENICTRYHPI